MEKLTCVKCNKEFSDAENLLIISALTFCGQCAIELDEVWIRNVICKYPQDNYSKNQEAEN